MTNHVVSKLHISTFYLIHPSRSAKHYVFNLGSSSISCFKTSISPSIVLPERGKSSSSKLPFLNRCCAIRMESASLPFVPHMLLTLLCDSNRIHEAEALGALYEISSFIIQDQRRHPLFCCHSKDIRTPLLYALFFH